MNFTYCPFPSQIALQKEKKRSNDTAPSYTCITWTGKKTHLHSNCNIADAEMKETNGKLYFPLSFNNITVVKMHLIKNVLVRKQTHTFVHMMLNKLQQKYM